MLAVGGPAPDCSRQGGNLTWEALFHVLLNFPRLAFYIYNCIYVHQTTNQTVVFAFDMHLNIGHLCIYARNQI